MDARFGPPPSRFSNVQIAAGQYAATIVLLIMVRPPFVLNDERQLDAMRVLVISGLAVATALATWSCGATPNDLFFGGLSAVVKHKLK